MPPKKPPYEYTDANRPPFLEDLELASAISYEQRRGWQFLPETQLDTNYAEWKSAAENVPFSAEEIAQARMQAYDLTLIHACAQDAIEDFAETGLLTSHRFRTEHPNLYPRYRARPGYPTATESALQLDNYVNFSFKGFSFFADRPGMYSVEVNALDLLKNKAGIVFPFDSMAFLTNTPFHERPVILQALALRTSDYASLLPELIAAHNRNDPSSVLPKWFATRFGGRSFVSAEVKITDHVYLAGLVKDITNADNSIHH